MKDWFKNIFSYRITPESRVYKEEEIAELIEDYKIGGFAAGELETSGFGKVFGNEYFFAINSECFLFSYQIDKKDIPSKLVNKLVKEANADFIRENGQSMSKNELMICKEEVINKLLPNAFIKTSNIMGYINYSDMTMVVDVSSPSKFDLFSSSLREVLLDLKTTIINPDIEVSRHLGEWLSEYDVFPNNKSIEIDSSFNIGENCVLKQPSDDAVATITIANKVLDDDDIRNHLLNGAIVENLGLSWEDKLTFSIASNFRVSKVKSTDLVSDIVDDSMGDYDMKGLDEDEALLKEYKRVSYGVMIEYFEELQRELIKLFSK